MKVGAFITLLIFLTLFCGCTANGRYAELQNRLNEFVTGKDATIGVAVIIDGRDTVTVNGGREFPMLSVYKFPIVLAFGEYYRQNNLSIDVPVDIQPQDLHLDTYSPMTEKIMTSSQMIADTIKMPAKELVAYILQQSDNNASDIVLKGLNGADYVERYLNRIGIIGINVKNSEREMHYDNSLCYVNSSTPLAMASLIDKFDREYNDSISLEIKHLMETCVTGSDRLNKPLAATNAVIGHKTGTGFTLPDGRLMAVNDAGYVHLPNGQRYTIAVFVENSGYSMAGTEALIAEISGIVFSNLINPDK